MPNFKVMLHDKYDRPLVVLKGDREDEESFNDLLVKYGYAEVYEK